MTVCPLLPTTRRGREPPKRRRRGDLETRGSSHIEGEKEFETAKSDAELDAL